MILTFFLFAVGFMFFLGVVLVVAHCFAKAIQNNEFQKNMIPGQTCYCFMDYDEIPYEIKKIDGCVITIEDEEGTLLAVSKTELYV